MTTIFQKCFVCTKQIEDTELTASAVQTESSFVFTHVLNLPNLDLDWHTFQHQVSYCSVCLEKITKIRLVLEQLEQLENEVLRQKYEFELKLKENKFEYFEIPGQNQSSLAPVAELRGQIVTELKSRTIISMLAKIRKKRGNSDQIGCPVPPRVMKSVTIPRLSTPTIVSTVSTENQKQSTTSTMTTKSSTTNCGQNSPIVVPFSKNSTQYPTQNIEFEHLRLRELLTGKIRIPGTERNMESQSFARRSSTEVRDERTITRPTPSSAPIPVIPPRRSSQIQVDLIPHTSPQENRRRSISNSDSILDILTDNIPSSSQNYLEQRVIPIPHFLNPFSSSPPYNDIGTAGVNTAVSKNPRNVQQGQGPIFRVKSETILPEMEVDQTSEEEMSYICGICGEILHDYNLLMEHDKLHSKPTEPSQIRKDHDQRRPTVDPKLNSVNSTNIITRNVIEKNPNSSTSKPNSNSAATATSFVIPSSGDCPIKCVECGKTLGNAQELGEHIVRAHPHGSGTNSESTAQFQFPTTTVRVTPKKYYECKFCPKKFSVAIHLEQHLMSHNRTLAPLECHLCRPPKIFKSKDHFLLHKLNHTSSGR